MCNFRGIRRWEAKKLTVCSIKRNCFTLLAACWGVWQYRLGDLNTKRAREKLVSQVYLHATHTETSIHTCKQVIKCSPFIFLSLFPCTLFSLCSFLSKTHACVVITHITYWCMILSHCNVLMTSMTWALCYLTCATLMTDKFRSCCLCKKKMLNITGIVAQKKTYRLTAAKIKVSQQLKMFAVPLSKQKEARIYLACKRVMCHNAQNYSK